MDLITNLQSFLRVAETASFSAVAVERGVTQPAISRQVSALEEYLGARLVQRSTQAVTLTEEGRNLLLPAQELVDAAEGIRSMTGQWERKPVGSVRIALPVAIGLHVSDRIAPLLGQYEGLSVELIMRDHAGNLVEEGLDLGVQIGDVDDASLICRRVGSTSSLVVASAAYLESRQHPQHPLDLAAHHCIVHNRSANDNVWWFADKGKPSTEADRECSVTVRGRFSTDNASAAYRAAINGHGIACLSHLLVEEDIASGRLHRLLPTYEFRREPLFITYASRRRLPHRTRAVIDFLVKLLQEDPQMRL